MYDLYGVCNHLGNVSGGHYTSFVKQDEKWYHCDDETIQILEESNMVMTKFAYCLFYMKRKG
jgi:ubiquitin C-terminal hydrolase